MNASRRLPCAWFGSLLALVALLTACGDSGVTTGDTEGGTVGPGDATTDAEAAADVADSGPEIPPRDAAACASCELTSCASQVSACQKNAQCAAIVTCAEACDPATATKCTQVCLTANPGGASDFNALATCVNSTCAAACAY